METNIATDLLTKGPGTGDVVVRMDKICKAFGDHVVLKDLSLDVKRGENLMVLGKSGSGKSVLIKCVVRLLTPESGTITVLGEDLLSLDDVELDRLRGRIGFLFQRSALYDSMTVRENLIFPQRRHVHERTQEEIDAAVEEALENVGLLEAIDKMPSELSGGMQKRAALARTLITRPEIVLYDEPTTGLDPVTSKEIVELILELQKKYNTSSIIISHDLNVAKLAADRIIVLHNGGAHAEGTYDELYHSNDPVVKQFFIFM